MAGSPLSRQRPPKPLPQHLPTQRDFQALQAPKVSTLHPSGLMFEAGEWGQAAVPPGYQKQTETGQGLSRVGLGAGRNLAESMNERLSCSPCKGRPGLAAAGDEWRTQAPASGTTSLLAAPARNPGFLSTPPFDPQPHPVVSRACRLSFQSKSRLRLFSLSPLPPAVLGWTLQQPPGLSASTLAPTFSRSSRKELLKA